MGPEYVVWFVAADPVGVHILQQVFFTSFLEEGSDVRACVWGHGGAVWGSGCGVGRGMGIVLAGEVAVLSVTSVTVVRPEAMYAPVCEWGG